MTSHQTLQERLAYYRDLAAIERQEVDAHLAGCGECRSLLAANQQQDEALAALPTLRPSLPAQRQSWQAPGAGRGRQAVARLGDMLVLGGITAMLWVFALQLQSLNAQGTGLVSGTPAQGALEPGLALPPTAIHPPSPWLPALPWLAGSLLTVGLLLVLSRRNWWLAVAGAVVAATLLASFVPPLSAIPNPAGLYWRVVGGYSYDPNLPFKNEFVIAGRPEAQLRPRLDALIGEVGLAPLDPVQPLTRYEILRVGLHPARKNVALVTTRFIYADGSSRVYPVPMLRPAIEVAGFWLAAWQNDGLERLRSDHLALPGQPFANGSSLIQLGPARQIALHPAANRLDEANPGHWLWGSVRVQQLVWAPDASAFLLAVELKPSSRQLWRVPLDGSPPVLEVAGDVRQYGWSPDGSMVVVTRLDPDAASVDPARVFAVVALDVTHRSQARTLVTALVSDQLPGLTADGAWFFTDGTLWLAPYDGAAARPVLQQMQSLEPAGAPRPSPDAARVAFACGTDICLLHDPLTAPANTPPELMRVPGRSLAEAAWTRDSSRLAAIDRSPNDLAPVRLLVIGPTDDVLLSVDIAPGEATDVPQWTGDGAAVLVQTYPQNGRRMIAIDVASAQVLDLSQEHWDAYFALSPDGQALLLNNGRGDFWMADVVRR